MNQMDWKQEYADKIAAFTRLSAETGARTDYVQGGGGNTSIKLDETYMAVKASGYCLSQVTQDSAFAVLDYRRLRAFFAHAEANTPDREVEAAGRAAVENARVDVAGMAALRPSVEAGFHALLGTCVLHTHSVYVNSVCCSSEFTSLTEEVMSPLGLAWGMVPYIDPGTRLTFAVAKEVARLHESGEGDPMVLFLQNHGVVVSAADVSTCLEVHHQVNTRLMEVLRLSPAAWPRPSIAVRACGTGFQSQTAWLQQQLRKIPDPVRFFTRQPLYPDQMVYLEGKLARAGADHAKAVCHIDTGSGEVIYTCGAVEAAAIEETLCAVMFIHQAQSRAGITPQPMSAAAQSFIAGWESEAYRRQVASQDQPRGTRGDGYGSDCR